MKHSDDDHLKHIHRRMLWWAVWCIVGTGAVVVAYMQGLPNVINPILKDILSRHPFYLSKEAFSLSPMAMLMLSISVSLFFTNALLKTPSLVKRLVMLCAVLLAIALTVPVLAMWGVYFAPSSVLLSMAVSGLGATLTALFIRPSATVNEPPTGETDSTP